MKLHNWQTGAMILMMMIDWAVFEDIVRTLGIMGK